ncbi:MAG: protein adenylyltransferase SelO family protein, partial [Pseudobdellovibrionaceae bacterium]|nr:protein adenylyltransferase SelO family protein [Pseudobdellovibrionaceae bacterium]
MAKTFPHPQICLFNEGLTHQLNLDSHLLQSQQGILWLSAQQLPPGAQPIALAYGGHQFGVFNILGDGRALLLGEHIDHRGNRWDIHLKGTGPTPFSRGGDGLAALGPMLREFLVSEALHYLKLPTTR